MSAQENEKLIRDIFSGLSKGDGRLFMDCMTDDFSWTISGSTSWSGTYRGKTAVRKQFLGLLSKQFSSSYLLWLDSVIAGEEYVAVECHGEVVVKDWGPYRNKYCWICRIVDGKLYSITEYLDTELLAKAFQPPLRINSEGGGQPI